MNNADNIADPKPQRTLFSKDFTLVIIGQIISLFGNGILRFALPLYVLDQSSSPALFGIVSAASFLPMILLSPIGGMIADRVNKQRIMVILDFSTSVLILGYILAAGYFEVVPLVVIVLMFLYAIQGAYTPAVQSSIPILVAPDLIVQGNAAVNLVNSLASLLGPVIGGMLYGTYGLTPILYASCFCFFLSAIIELFIKIPHKKIASSDSVIKTAVNDIKESLHFIIKENPFLAKGIVIIFLLNLFLSSIIIIGMPVLITQTLGMSSRLYGFSQGALAAGGLAGGIMAGVLGNRLNIKNSYLLLMLCAIGLLPMSFTLLTGAPIMVSYLVITAMNFLIMMGTTIFSIQILSFVQMQTPAHMMGKVISCVMALSICAQPLGQTLYGLLFEKLAALPWIVVLFGAVMSFIIAAASKKTFASLNS